MKIYNIMFMSKSYYTLLILRAILNKSWWQHPTRHQLYGHLPPIMKTIQVRQTRHAGHCWRSKDELISDVLWWTPTYGQAKAGRPARTYIQQLCEDTGCNLEDLPEAMNNREKWRERVRDIHAGSTTWWWWWWWWILCVASLSLNNCFNTLWNRCIQILHYHKYEMPFSVAELPQLFKIVWILPKELFSSVFICLMIFKLGLWAG